MKDGIKKEWDTCGGASEGEGILPSGKKGNKRPVRRGRSAKSDAISSCPPKPLSKEGRTNPDTCRGAALREVRVLSGEIKRDGGTSGEGEGKREERCIAMLQRTRKKG